MNNNQNIPAAVSINLMCRLLNLSRARFYSLISISDISKCFFIPPIYSIENQRPYFTREMAQQNIDFKKNSTGWNNKVLLFYNSRNSFSVVKPKKKEKQEKQNNDKHAELIAGLEGLGIAGINTSQIDAALSVCFPQGCQNVDDAEKLRVIFRHFKQKNHEHKQRA